MRAVRNDELEFVAGGLIKGPGGGGGTGGGGSGGGGSGGGSGSGGDGGGSGVTEAEFESGMKSALDLAANGLLDTGLVGAAFKDTDWAALAGQVNSTLFAQGEHDYTTFESSGIDEHDPPQYINVVSWNHINWHAYDNGGKATPAQAMQNLLNDINNNHHVALDPNTTKSGVNYGAYTGGWNPDGTGGEYIAVNANFSIFDPSVTVGDTVDI